MIYKNVDETVIGTSTFTNNFVQFITSGNYWDPSNNLKPLVNYSSSIGVSLVNPLNLVAQGNVIKNFTRWKQ